MVLQFSQKTEAPVPGVSVFFSSKSLCTQYHCKLRYDDKGEHPEEKAATYLSFSLFIYQGKLVTRSLCGKDHINCTTNSFKNKM